ncbi:helix-turn-helix domain-containing protein [Microbacterium trichothecenolyticum]|uniref:AraC-like DNA-binding protein n=1 Tax=Microbacterium trichothecenolyticum TaxID=69370 RepID=A0ABU0TYP7_MICTR|nr:helix-turn-helix domain-containing protein [Microbacterium trichothecenolyticum]MDQ1124635.1 AraC-like DNA-binding protein [Microbacterium trichothecenolyticum]
MAYWSLDALPAKERFPFWREVLCQAFTPLSAELDGRRGDEPSGWVRSARLAESNGAEIASRTQVITHGRSEIGRTDEHFLFVNVVLEGRCVVEQDGRRAAIPAGGFSVVDTTREYRQHYIEDPGHRRWRVLSYRLPRTRVLGQLHDPGSVTATLQTGERTGASAVALSTMLGVWRNAERLDPTASLAAETAVHAVVVAALDNVARRTASWDRAQVDGALRAEIERHVQRNLRDGDLSAAATAQRFAISLRKLHALYEEGEQSYARMVMLKRLEACASDLRAGIPGTLGDLAKRWGFSDLSHLNRAFRKQYGTLPSEYRVSSVGWD